MPVVARSADGQAEAATTPRSLPAVVVIIVAYRNVADVVACLRALATLAKEPSFEVFICENGGPEAYDQLLAALCDDDGRCIPVNDDDLFDTPELCRRTTIGLKEMRFGRRVHVGEARANLGYAGGINAWLRPLLAVPDWSAAWILNPDTQPSPDALAELAAYAARQRVGMVGSRLVPNGHSQLVQSRGLAWRPWRAKTLGVDYHAPAEVEPDALCVDARLDSPSGASVYVTRACIEAIGLMDERYFLYFEDLDWGLRAKRRFGVGYAHRSVVHHAGGTTIGGTGHRAHHSRLSVYLDFRNRLLFVREHFPRWLPWTVLMAIVHAMRFAWAWPPRNLIAALRGIAAGIAGETGRPDHILRHHRPSTAR